ncbi:MAG: GldG family protein [Patescibacteria group bacterium]|nr:GldG family protein [Patescibacteria group bacterium]
MPTSKKQLNAAAAATAIVLAGVLVLVVNLISLKLFGRWDATENKNYSISNTTKQLVRGLDDVVNIKAYFTSELPGHLLTRNLDVRGILAEFENASRGNVAVTYLDPGLHEDLKSEAAGIGIPMLQFNVLRDDAFTVTNGYLGIAVFYGDNREILPIVQDAATLEYDLAAAIGRATAAEALTIGFVSDKASQPPTQLTRVWDMLSDQYRVEDVTLAHVELIPEQIDVLVVPGPSQLNDRDLYVLDQFLMSGGGLLVLGEGTNVNFQDLTVEKRSGKLGEFLAHSGVRLNQNLALDVSHELAPFRTDQTQFYAPYPFWIKIQKAGFNPEAGPVRNLESLVLTWASTIDVLEEGLDERTIRTDLIRTTTGAWIQDNDWQLNPRLIEQPGEERRGSYVLGTMLSGYFESMFQADSIPDRIIADGDDVSEVPATQQEREKFKAETEKGALIVIGDADFLLDVNVNRFAANAVFFASLVDALSGDASLSDIRSKGITDRPLKQISGEQKNQLKWLNIAGVPLLFAGYGLFRSHRRRRNISIS